jgi:hypothetical protein
MLFCYPLQGLAEVLVLVAALPFPYQGTPRTLRPASRSLDGTLKEVIGPFLTRGSNDGQRHRQAMQLFPDLYQQLAEGI